MLFVAPVVSKSLASQHANMPCAVDSVAMQDMPAMHHAMPGKENAGKCEVHQGTPHHLLPSAGSSPMEDIACGYCQLLIHLPLIQNVFTPFVWLIEFVSQAPFLPVILSPLLCVCYCEYQPRAPPNHCYQR